MPHKDPATGVPVLSTLEFFAKTAEYEGKEVGEVMDDFFADMEKARLEDQERLREHVLEFAQAMYDDETLHGCDWYGDDWKPYSFTLESLVKVEVCELDAGLRRDSHQKVVFLAACSDGKIRRVTAKASHYSGTWLEPPEDEEELLIEDLNG